MAILPSDQTKINFDAATDDPTAARAEFADNVDKFNQVKNGLGVFWDASAGNGLAVSGSIASIDLATNSGLEFSAGKLIAKVTTGNQLSSAGIGMDINGLVEETTLDGVNDFIPIYDASGAIIRKVKLSAPGKVTAINALTEDASPDLDNDFVMSFDNSASVNKKVKLGNLGGALVLLASATASASSSIAFTTGITSTHDKYILLWEDVIYSGSGTQEFSVSTNGGSTYISPGYAYSSIKMNASSTDWATGVSENGAAGNGFDLQSGDNSINSTTKANGYMEFHSPASTGTINRFYTWRHFFNKAGGFQTLWGWGNVSSAPVNAVKFTSLTSTITSGEFRLYGIRQ